MFDWSGPAIFLVFELSQSVLVIHQECSQSTQDTSGFHQDSGYHSRKGYCWFLNGLLIFDFSLNLTGPDMQKLNFQFLDYH